MFQSFDETARPEQGPARLAALRSQFRQEGLAGFLVPRADAHQGEYVAPRDDRLAWLTGFTGSAGFCAVLQDVAGVFIDGRYRTQVKGQIDPDHFTPVPWPDVNLHDWLIEKLPNGGAVGFDPWLHTTREIEILETALTEHGIVLRPVENLVDAIWPDQPSPPQKKVRVYPDDLAGDGHATKRARLAEELRSKSQNSAVITLPDSLAWLLNIRGGDIPRNPVPHGFAILRDNGHLSLFIDNAKLDDDIRRHLGPDITIRPTGALAPALHSQIGKVRVDKATAPHWVSQQLIEANVAIAWDEDPCLLPKSCKTDAEIAGTTEAHLRDGAAMCELLSWFEARDKTALSEIDIVSKLEDCRQATGALLDISFDTICGSGPHGAIMHYRVTRSTNRKLQDGDLVVLDSGGQYLDGTTDVTRTLPVGEPGVEERTAFTRVLQGMIAISRLRWPGGLAGRDLDAIARYPLWLAGQDFNHGTGHGVGVFLCVHEGPQRLARTSHVPLKPGMILSNEPGYYREGAFGIRIENLVVVREAPELEGADDRNMLSFDTLTYVPIDRRLIIPEMLNISERDWLNAYHAVCRDKIGPRLGEDARIWLDAATVPL